MEKAGKTELDEVDMKIIEELEKDARMSFREIAKKLEISEGTVYNRVKRMQKEGVIKGFSAKVDPAKVGLDLTVVVGLTITGGHLVEVEHAITKKYKEVCCVYDVTGGYDAIVIARFPSRVELNKFIKEILANEFVERTATHVVLNTVKEDFTTLV